MSSADHFDSTPDAGFVRCYDAEAARRQLRVSLLLIMVLACAAAALACMSRLDASASQSHPASARERDLAVAHSSLDIPSSDRHTMT